MSANAANTSRSSSVVIALEEADNFVVPVSFELRLNFPEELERVLEDRILFNLMVCLGFFKWFHVSIPHTVRVVLRRLYGLQERRLALP